MRVVDALKFLAQQVCPAESLDILQAVFFCH